MTKTTRARFHSLFLTKVRLLTEDSVGLTFLVPDELLEQYRFQPGQYLTLKTDIDGQSVRRSYSIASGIDQPNRLEVGIRQVPSGLFSTHACAMSAGIYLDVMTPQGMFTAQPTAGVSDGSRHFLFIAAGSGITPCLSIIKSLLVSDPQAVCTLVFGNRTFDSMMFADDIKALKDRHTDRFSIINVLSQERQESQLLRGRIDGTKLDAFLDTGLLTDNNWHAAYCCGPEPMLDEVTQWLEKTSLSSDQIHRELFVAVGDSGNTVTRVTGATEKKNLSSASDAELHIKIDGTERQIPLRATSETVLEAATRAGLELPFSCAGGMCCTCRCKVLEGDVTMDANYSLARWEVEAGYTLACQSRSSSDKLVVDFDAT